MHAYICVASKGLGGLYSRRRPDPSDVPHMGFMVQTLAIDTRSKYVDLLIYVDMLRSGTPPLEKYPVLDTPPLRYPSNI